MYKRTTYFLTIALLTIALFSSAIFAAENPKDKDLNEYVLDVISSFELGAHPYKWTNDYTGVTEDLVYQDKLIGRAHPEEPGVTYCVGLTFEVFFKAMQQRNLEAGLPAEDFNGMDFDELLDFRSTWYIAKSLPLDECHMAAAIVNYGIGEQIFDFAEVKPGDFVQIWRTTGSGHGVIFIDWVVEEDHIVGIEYWSTQTSTGGLNYNVEYFSDNPEGLTSGTVKRDETYIGRVGPINSYKPFK